MNILYHFRTRGSGAEAVHIAGIARAMETLGHTVVFSSPTGVDPRVTAGASPFKDSGRGGLVGFVSRNCPAFLFEFLELGYNVAAWFRNTRLLRRQRFELIYERHAFFMFATSLLAQRRRIPFVVEVNELVGDERVRQQPCLAGLVRRCDRMTFQRASLIVVVSPHLKRRIVEQGITAEKILVLPNAVNREEFATPAEGDAVRQRWHLHGSVVIGFVGWFVAWHRLESLIDAVVALSRSHPEVRLLLIGEGGLRDALTAAARHHGILDKVIFTGAVPHTEIPAHIAAMDIAVVPHSNEYRSPIKLFEYLGQGKAVVAPRTEPMEMVVRDRVNGVLFEPGSPEGLREALAMLVVEPELRARLGAQARRDVLERHTWGHNAAAVLGRLSL